MAAKRNRSGDAARANKYAGVPGVISVTDIYHVDEAKLRLRWTDSAYRAARRRGLAVINDGKRVYVTGQAIQRYLEAATGRAPASACDASP